MTRLAQAASIIRSDIGVGIAAALGLAVVNGVLIALDLAPLGFAMVLGLFLGCVFLKYPVSVIYLLVVVQGVASGIPRGRLIPILSINEVLLIFAFGLTFLSAVLIQRPRVFQWSFIVALAALVLGTAIMPVIAYTLRGYRLSFGEIFKLIAPVQYLLLLVVSIYLPSTTRQRVTIFHTMIFCSTVDAVIGLLQAARIPPVVSFLIAWFPTDQTSQAESAGRVTSVFGAWNALGVFLMFNLLLIVALSQYAPFTRSRLARINIGISAFTSLACLLASGSYASIIGLVAGIFLILTINGRIWNMWRAIVSGFVLSIVSFVALSPLVLTRLTFQFSQGGIIPNTVLYRFHVWQDIYLPLIATNPIWGVTPTTENVSFGFAESQYLLLLYRSGVFSMVAEFVYIFLMMLWLWRKRHVADELAQTLAIFLYVLMVLLIFMSLTNPVFTYSGSMDYKWLLTGLLIGLQGSEHLPPKKNDTSQSLS